MLDDPCRVSAILTPAEKNRDVQWTSRRPILGKGHCRLVIENRGRCLGSVEALHSSRFGRPYALRAFPFRLVSEALGLLRIARFQVSQPTAKESSFLT